VSGFWSSTEPLFDWVRVRKSVVLFLCIFMVACWVWLWLLIGASTVLFLGRVLGLELDLFSRVFLSFSLFSIPLSIVVFPYLFDLFLGDRLLEVELSDIKEV